MLVLTRRKGQDIIIDSDIKITVLAVSENQVKLGVVAPIDKEIYRGELVEDIKVKTKEAREKSKSKVLDLSKVQLNKVKR